ncbi:MAG TPA: M14 family zinc carboxypeptidase [Gemmatimonadales bacterium]|nr:M14 family zinc carboxypeptidase [Gemmatimonadales bacterium]
MRPLLTLLVWGSLVSPLAAQEPFDFYSRGPYRPAVPRPEAITGYAAGEQQTMYAVMQHYLDTLVATATDRVGIESWGRTTEYRPIRALIISDPANLARLDQIRAGIAELIDPRKTSPARAAAIAAQSPAVAVFNYSVHGDEPAGFEAAMQVAYQLAASDEPQTQEILKQVVVVLNPSANPDGHERFAAWYNSVGIGADHPWALEQNEPWSITGRYSHYRFDMNRDLLAQSQPEVRAIMDGILRWHPQVFVDHHSTTSSFFFPPVAQAVNMNLPPQTTKWFATYGRGNAAAFDRYGWQYYVGGVFDFFYVGYWDEWTTFQGATGMTYETDGGPEFRKRRDDGSITTFRDGIAHHFGASLATLETTAKNRQTRLQDYYDFRRSAMADAATDRMKRVVIVPGNDPQSAAHVIGLLLRNGIEVTRLRQPLSARLAHAYISAGTAATARTFPAGSYVVDLNQPQRRIAKAMLEPQASMERSFVQREIGKFQRNRRRGDDTDKEDYGFYDITAWSLPLSFNLDAYWTEDAGPSLPGDPVADSLVPPPAAPARAVSGYAFLNDRPGAARLALALEAEDFRLAVTRQPILIGGRSYPRGTFVARVQRNGPTLYDRIAALGPALGVPVFPLQTAFPDTGDAGIGSEDVTGLHAPRILVAAGDGISETSYGWLWHYLARELNVAFTPVPLRAIGRVDDLQTFNVIIIPDGSGGRMRRELGDDGAEKLKAWVRSGGVLIGYGGAGDLAANKDLGLSSIASVAPDSGAKADTAAAGDAPPLVSKTAAPRDRPEWIPGAIFRATLDTTHWLTAGYDRNKIPVFIDGDTFWRPSKGGANAAAFTDPADSLVLSGFTWPDNTARLLKGSTWAAVENQGSGRVVLFLSDPLFRAFWRGPAKMLTNAILIGPNR